MDLEINDLPEPIEPTREPAGFTYHAKVEAGESIFIRFPHLGCGIGIFPNHTWVGIYRTDGAIFTNEILKGPPNSHWIQIVPRGRTS